MAKRKRKTTVTKTTRSSTSWKLAFTKLSDEIGKLRQINHDLEENNLELRKRLSRQRVNLQDLVSDERARCNSLLNQREKHLTMALQQLELLSRQITSLNSHDDSHDSSAKPEQTVTNGVAMAQGTYKDDDIKDTKVTA